jgi:8-oxo-dGTP pyrophosphatase MutT (NUDIX family)
MSDYKTETIDGKQRHFAVGAIIKQDDKILLMDRKKKPLGFACPAGHIDNGETPEKALFREVKEETGLDIKSFELSLHEFFSWNTCSNGIEGHEVYIYDCETEGLIVLDKKEAHSLKWYTKEELIKLYKDKKLESLWEEILKKLEFLK